MSSTAGFSLIEVMVAAAILAITSLAMLTMVDTMSLSSNALKFRSSVDVTSDEIRAVLSVPGACLQSFQGMNTSAVATTSVTKLFDGVNPKEVYNIGDIYDDRSVMLRKMQLNGTPTAGRLALEIDYDTVRSANGGASMHRTIFINAVADGAGKLIECVALAKMSDGIWHYNPKNLDQVFYNGLGKPHVGIGVPVPVTALDANGAIKVGSEPAPCVPALQGAMRYNTAGKTVEFCDGANWRGLAALQQKGCHWIWWRTPDSDEPLPTEAICPVGEYVAGNEGRGLTTKSGHKRDFGRIYCCQP